MKIVLTKVFGLSMIEQGKWNKQKSLPLYIAESYNFNTTYIGEIRCIMLTPINEFDTVPTLKKQIAKIRQIDNAPVVLKLTTISDYRRENLIENNIPFITNKQVFLPFIGAILMKEREKEKQVEKFMFSTQLLFLSYLYNKEKRAYISDLGRMLPYTGMTLTRATRQLEATDLFNIGKNGVNKFIESKYSRYELYKKTRDYLSSPVIAFGYIDKDQIRKEMVFAGETLLSEKTMLNPSKLITYAISEKEYDRKKLNNELVDPSKQVKLELWAYNPRGLVNNGYADDVSVALSFKDNNDERIEEAIDELLKKGLDEK